jgi:hypothetical protein
MEEGFVGPNGRRIQSLAVRRYRRGKRIACLPGGLMFLGWPVLKRPKALRAGGSAGSNGGVLVDPFRQPLAADHHNAIGG